MAKRENDAGVRLTVIGTTQRGQDRKQVAPAGKARSLRRTRSSPRRPARGVSR